MYQERIPGAPPGMDTSHEPIVTTQPIAIATRAVPYHADNDTPCDTPGPCSFVRLVYWRKESV